MRPLRGLRVTKASKTRDLTAPARQFSPKWGQARTTRRRCSGRLLFRRPSEVGLTRSSGGWSGGGLAGWVRCRGRLPRAFGTLRRLHDRSGVPARGPLRTTTFRRQKVLPNFAGDLLQVSGRGQFGFLAEVDTQGSSLRTRDTSVAWRTSGSPA